MTAKTVPNENQTKDLLVKTFAKNQMNEPKKSSSESTVQTSSKKEAPQNEAGILYKGIERGLQGIQKGAQAIGRAWTVSNIGNDLTMVNIGLFLANINSKRTHLEAVVYTEKIITSEDSHSPIQSAIIQQGNTYGGKAKEECDVCHLDEERGYSFMMDGTGHTDEKMGNAMREISIQFKKDYNEGIDERGGKFTCIEEAEVFMKKQVETLAKNLKEYEPRGIFRPTKDGAELGEVDKYPTLALTQIVIINDKSYLLTAETGDSPVAILTKDENNENIIKYTNTKKLAAGNIDYRGVATNTSLIKYSINELKEGDQILMCTDGITDFVKKDQFKEIAFAKNPMAKYNESIYKKDYRLNEKGEIKKFGGQKNFNDEGIEVSHNQIKPGNTKPQAGSVDDVTIIRYSALKVKSSVGDSI